MDQPERWLWVEFLEERRRQRFASHLDVQWADPGPVLSSWRRPGRPRAVPTTPQYQVYDGNSLASTTSNVDQRYAPGDFTDAGVSWKSLPWIYVTSGTVVVTLTSTYSGYSVVADAVRLQAVVGHGGTDDNFHVASDSPTIDAGDPASYYLSEPVPNGGRINLGCDGNTPQAALSTVRKRCRCSRPTGWRSLRSGSRSHIQWRTSGLTERQTVALHQCRQHGRRGRLVAERLPDDRLLQQFLQQRRGHQRRGESCAGGGLSDVQPMPSTRRGQPSWLMRCRCPTGRTRCRLHFAEPSYTSSNQRKFDVQLNGSVVQSGYDVFAAAGAQYKATALSFDVTASGGSGILLELVNLTADGAILSGIELTSANVGGVPAPTVNLDVSTDNGSSWTAVATDLAMDASGQGSYAWTAGPETAGNTALVRVRANDGTQPQDTSDQGFLMANAGADYYVAVTGDNAQQRQEPGRCRWPACRPSWPPIT